MNQAVTKKSVTLLTREFGRGTDFICYDDEINNTLGGVHVLQTFLSVERAEERQIKGRTARQGRAGTYSMVLLKNDLERIDINDSAAGTIKHKQIFPRLLSIPSCPRLPSTRTLFLLLANF